MKFIHFQILSIITLFICAFFNAPSHALDVETVRIGHHPDKTRIVIELNSFVDYKAFLLNNPYRLIVDLPMFVWQAGEADPPSPSGVTDIRHSAYQPGISRIVFDLDNPYIIKTAFMLPPGQNSPRHRLVLDLQKASLGEFSNGLHRHFGSLSMDNIPAPPPVSVERHVPAPREKPLIVIDAGHGGNDPGAISPQRILEKNITLALAQQLKKELESSGKYRVKLTRDRDHYIKLRERVNLARKWGGDMFISLHADSIEKRDVRGASIYTLSDKSSDAQTAKLAAQENRSDIIAGVDLSHEDKAVANILIDLASTHTKNQSRYFANLMVDEFKDNNINVLPNTHRYAGFAVLKAPDIPSILIEAGFISNRKEAELLAKEDYRLHIARTIRKGIDTYFMRVYQNEQ
jgi:N-acetylmuramoyl-L-alanine amidase